MPIDPTHTEVHHPTRITHEAPDSLRDSFARLQSALAETHDAHRDGMTIAVNVHYETKRVSHSHSHYHAYRVPSDVELSVETLLPLATARHLSTVAGGVIAGFDINAEYTVSSDTDTDPRSESLRTVGGPTPPDMQTAALTLTFITRDNSFTPDDIDTLADRLLILRRGKVTHAGERSASRSVAELYRECA